MKVGLIGKRSSGKTTLFEALCGTNSTANTASGLVNISKVRVKDENIDALTAIFKPKKTTYAEFDLIDYNRAHDASDAVLGSPALIAKYREFDALVLVAGVIDDKSKASAELEDIILELNLSDMMILEAKIQRMKKGAYDKAELALYEKILAKLESNEPMNYKDFTKDEIRLLSCFQLFCIKPVIAAMNVTEDLMASASDIKINRAGVSFLALSAEIEKELNSLGKAERQEFLKDLNLSGGISDRFINTLYACLDLISFYTVGEDEVRAWSITRGDTALAAAGKIHSDIERGFIRASVMSYADFMKHGDEKKAQAAGVVRSEGKEYIVQTGEIIHFKFNV